MKCRQEMITAVSGRLLVLDGAMGSLLQRLELGEEDFRGLDFADHPTPLLGDNELLNVTRPEVIADLHRQYVSAGADIITTNTFGANRVCQGDYGLSSWSRRLSTAGALVARQVADAADREVYVAGSVGPTNKTASMSSNATDPAARDIDYATLRTAYREQVAGLLDGGVDVLLLETVFDGLNAKAALDAIEEELAERHIERFPVMVSASLADRSGRILSGQTPEALLTSLERARLLTFGLNCSMGPAQMVPYLRSLREVAPMPLSAYPNAGLPDALGAYSQTPEQFAEALRPLIDDATVRIVGGCCGTTPDHIRAVRALVDERNARQESTPPCASRRETHLSGLDDMTIAPGAITLVGERCNVAGSRRFLRLIQEGKHEQALDIAREEVRDGAHILDVNFDDGLLDAAKEMTHFLRLLMSDPAVARVPVMIDSSRFDVIEAGLECLQGRSVVNSLSLKHGEAQFVREAEVVRRHGAAAVVMLFDERGQATTLPRRQEVAQRAFDLLTRRVGLPANDVIFDPNVLALATGLDGDERTGTELLDAIGWLHRTFPESHISVGLSNLSFSFRGNDVVRQALHAVFLSAARPLGLDMAIVNPGHPLSVEALDGRLREVCEELLLRPTDETVAKLAMLGEELHGSPGAPRRARDEAWRNQGVEQRLTESIVRGETQYIDRDLEEALQNGASALGLVDGPLMKGMGEVGQRFSEGSMILPEVVKTARAMHSAVEMLRPLIEAEKGDGGATQGTIVLATVKGDVHDIGKNIVSVVMQCNGWRVVDLGVMVKAEAVADAVERERADAVGLSGLITPSLDEMRGTLECLERRGIRVPVLIGGATTSELHTALRLAPVYSGPVVHVPDASANAQVLYRLLHDRTGEYLSALQARQDALRGDQSDTTSDRHHTTASPAAVAGPQTAANGDGPQSAAATDLRIDEARARAPQRDWDHVEYPRPQWQGVATLNNIDFEAFESLLNWRLVERGVRGLPGTAAENMSLCHKWLRHLVDERLVRAHGIVGVYGARRIEGETVALYNGEAGLGEELCRLTFPRKLRPNAAGECPSLADYVAPEPHSDHLGMFACTVGDGFGKLQETLVNQGDRVGAIACSAVLGALAEALSEWLHWRTRTALWGYDSSEPFDVETLLAGKYTGIRPAIGYPMCPDHNFKRTLFDVLGVEMLTPIRLTASTMMDPAASVCGFYVGHPFAKYF